MCSLDTNIKDTYGCHYRATHIRNFLQFSLDAKKPSNDYDVKFFSAQSTLQKNCELALHNNDVHRYL